MKKLVLTLTVIALAGASAFAQLSIGLKAGVNFANQKYSVEGYSISPEALTGFHVGAYLNIAASENISIQPELLYNSVGAKINDDVDGDYNMNFNYISVPVLLKYSPVPIFNVQVGPQFGFLMSAKADDEDIKDSYKGLDLGAAIGAGVDLPMGLNFTARYVLGLSNIYETEEDDDTSIKNNVIQLSIGYRLFGGE